MQATKDLKTYLDHLEELSKDLDEEQKKQLDNILSVILTLLVSFKKGSGLGNISMN